ncbi:MAG: 16S rRNA (cytidine(1402)-2'-O)-methyltransferase [Dehalococcoidia bacterium]|nr:16S rRNA (cytidine(1402)-2'-O)-methyltransferase [Dehalococcoidia bacterium]
MGTLYVVATPIGNPLDITLRALSVLASVALIASEDTRTTRRLLAHHGVQPRRLVSYTDHNKTARIPRLLATLGDGDDVALVSEAGVPVISDPGYDLVAAAAAAGHQVTPVPGASAVMAAIAASGLPARRFLFLGFLSRKAGERRTALRSAAAIEGAIVIFESPRRVKATLRDVLEVLGDRRMVAARELTKVHEEFLRGNVSQVLAALDQPLGEFTLVIDGTSTPSPVQAPGEAESLAGRLAADGLSTRDIARELAEAFAMSRREAYALATRAREAPGQDPTQPPGDSPRST